MVVQTKVRLTSGVFQTQVSSSELQSRQNAVKLATLFIICEKKLRIMYMIDYLKVVCECEREREKLCEEK